MALAATEDDGPHLRAFRDSEKNGTDPVAAPAPDATWTEAGGLPICRQRGIDGTFNSAEPYRTQMRCLSDTVTACTSHG
ncbi:hypothetical protein GFL86_26990 [Rhizobium laguerreae]|nr:hypothetical protein [Rhizobium laguerreae]